jgi:hypothetical protein
MEQWLFNWALNLIFINLMGITLWRCDIVHLFECNDPIRKWWHGVPILQYIGERIATFLWPGVDYNSTFCLRFWEVKILQLAKHPKRKVDPSFQGHHWPLNSPNASNPSQLSCRVIFGLIVEFDSVLTKNFLSWLVLSDILNHMHKSNHTS